VKRPTVRLDSVCERIDYGFTASADFRVTEPRLLRITDIQNGAVDWNHVPGCRITPKEEAEKRLNPGDIVFARTGATTGKCFLIKHAPRAVFASYLIRLRATDEVLPNYLYAFFQSQSYWHQIKGAVRGAAQGGVNSTTLSSLVVPMPDLSEQRRVAGEFEQADRLVRIRRSALELTDTFLPAAFLELFGDPSTNPNGFDQVQLDDELACIESGESPICEGPRQSVNQWAVLGLGAVTRGFLKPEENKRLPDDVKPRPELEVHDGDVLVTRKNTYDLVAACALVRRPPERLLLPDTIFRFRLKTNSRLSPVLLWGLFSFPTFRRRVQALASGSAGSMPGISKNKFKSIYCPAPPLPMQLKFAALVERVERIRAVQSEALRQAEHLFDSLLSGAFGPGG